MLDLAVQRHRTAINRVGLSRPIQLAISQGIVQREDRVFDYGCGRGDDLRLLSEDGYQCFGFDPVHRPDGERSAADVVNLGYVVNVIEDPKERASVLREAWSFAKRIMVVSARLAAEAKDLAVCASLADGVLTRLGTFQKFYEQAELRTWIDSTLEQSCVAAGPGVFYVFRDAAAREAFLASRVRRTSAAPRVRLSDRLFEEHRSLLEPLMSFFADRGRLPDPCEIATGSDIEGYFGSVKRAFSVIRRVTGNERWAEIIRERQQDLSLYLALARFNGRPQLSALPRDLQLDVKAFYSSYKSACAAADALLFSIGQPGTIEQACQESSIGKLTPTALYVHVSALGSLSPTLRVYEGCARGYIGTVDGANIVKLFRGEPKISYLSYPDFESDPHPALSASLSVNLQTFRVRTKSFIEFRNPPILHRKETFLAVDHPLRSKFERLTVAEEAHGLYHDTSVIGTRDGWRQVLQAKGLQLRGHRLVRARNDAGSHTR